MADLWDTPASNGPGAFVHLGTEEEVQELLDAIRAAEMLEGMGEDTITLTEMVKLSIPLVHPTHADHEIYLVVASSNGDKALAHCSCGKKLVLTGEQYMAWRA